MSNSCTQSVATRTNRNVRSSLRVRRKKAIAASTPPSEKSCLASGWSGIRGSLRFRRRLDGRHFLERMSGVVFVGQHRRAHFLLATLRADDVDQVGARQFELLFVT